MSTDVKEQLSLTEKMMSLDAAWERRKARALRLLTEKATVKWPRARR